MAEIASTGGDIKRAVERLEAKLDINSDKLEKKLETHSQKMEAKVELVQAEFRMSEARRSELYLTRRETEDKLDALDKRIDREVMPLVNIALDSTKETNSRLNAMMLGILLCLVTTVVTMLQTIFKFIPGSN